MLRVRMACWGIYRQLLCRYSGYMDMASLIAHREWTLSLRASLGHAAPPLADFTLHITSITRQHEEGDQSVGKVHSRMAGVQLTWRSSRDCPLAGDTTRCRRPL